MQEPRIIIVGRSDLGVVRENQEDSWKIHEPAAGSERRRSGRLMVVADGIGGSRAGEVASNLAATTIVDAYYAASADARTRLRSAIQQANHQILESTESNPQYRGMGTTVVAAVIEGDRLLVGWIGDSRAYLVRDRSLTQITRDHHGANVAGLKVQGAGLTRWLGMGLMVDPDMRQVQLQPGDRLLLCTDGLHGVISQDEILRSCRAPIARWADELIAAAIKNGAPDNVTLVAAHVERLPFAPHRHPPLQVGGTLDGMTITEGVGEDSVYLWYRADAPDGAKLLCILKPELQTDTQLLLEIEEEEESLSRVAGQHLAVIDRADSEKSLAYLCLHFPGLEGPAGPTRGECHSLEEMLQMADSLEISVEGALETAACVGEALEVVRESMLPAGAPHPSDFWGNGAEYWLCRWPSPDRRYAVVTSKGAQPDPMLWPYMPPDFSPEDAPGPATDAFFIGRILERLLHARLENAPPAVNDLLDALLAPSARDRPDALTAIRQCRLSPSI